MYEYEARHYDAAIARFVTIDPLAEDYSFQSTYTYAVNNPVYFVDKLGMGPTDEWNQNSDGSFTWVSDKGGDTVDYVNRLNEDGDVLYTEEMDVTDMTYVDNNSEIRRGVTKSPGMRTGMRGKAPGKGDMNWLEVIPEITTAAVVVASNELGVDPEVGLALATVFNMITNPVGGSSNAVKNGKRRTNSSSSRNKPKENGIPNSSEIQATTKGTITKYSTYDSNGKIIKEYRGTGKDHSNIPRPNVKEPNMNTNPKTGETFKNGYKVRKAKPEEIPGNNGG